jgi:histidinol phosphatase-like PHP family hydrolase
MLKIYDAGKASRISLWCSEAQIFQLYRAIERGAVLASNECVTDYRSRPLSNAEIADRLASLAQLLTAEKANPYKIRAYRRAAAVIRGLGESIEELVRCNEDLRVYAGIGEAISCSIHSRFAMEREKQTERILRAMDNRYFTVLGHATGRLLLKRPGYEIDFERIVHHAASRGGFFEINCSPDRLDVSAENARLVRAAGIKIAISFAP